MDNGPWERLQEWFDRAYDLPPEEREALVTALAEEDAPLAGQLRGLLAHKDAASAWEDREAPARAGVIEALYRRGPLPETAPDEEPVPDRIGPFLPQKLLGKGGMGVVYLARQLEPVERLVALKLLRRKGRADGLPERFQREYRMLALMAHPHIAQIFQAGTSADGRPYFAMEYIDGEPITVFCNRRRLSLDRRLDLMRDICAGLQHAHQKGIIHRDLKPSNLLVTQKENRAVAKIIDFGIAQPRDWSRRELEGDPAAFYGTLTYMSPEQMGEDKGPDTRTDIYALGAVLFELLTDAPVIDPALLREAREQGRPPRIDARTPVRPGTRLADAENLADIAAKRDTTPAKLVRAVRGDLDWIVTRALAPKKADRYAAVTELDEDLRRYRAGLPVMAAPDRFLYRTRKFLARHRAVSALAFLLIVTLAVGVAGLTRLWLHAEEARKETATALERAREGERFLLDYLAQPNPNDRAADVRGRFDAMETLLQDRGERPPSLRAAYHLVLGKAAYGWGLYEKAREHLESSREFWDMAAHTPFGERFETADFLARTYRRLGRFKEAETLYREQLGHQAAVLGEEAADTLRTRSELAATLTAAGRHDETIELCTSLLPAQLRMLGEKHGDVSLTRVTLGNALVGLSRFAEAEKEFRTALAIQWELWGPEDSRTLATENNLANGLASKGAYEQSERLYRRVLAVRTRVLYKDHPHTLSTMHGLARVLYHLGKLTEADELLRTVFEKRREALGPNHGQTLATQNNLALFYRRSGNDDRAIAMLREIIGIYTNQGEAAHPRCLRARNNLGNVLIQQGRSGEALPLLLETRDLKEQHPGRESRSYLDTLCTLAEAYQQEGNLEPAEDLFRETLAYATAYLEPGDYRHPQYRAYLALCLAAMGRENEADDVLKECLTFFQVRSLSPPAWLSRMENRRQCMREAGPAEP
ncbi:MAG: serine/threonine-protein kinase [Acidobacteriota bacterium]|nr:serine/threonine-protein kinase [Acidobacteriota bacterium]